MHSVCLYNWRIASEQLKYLIKLNSATKGAHGQAAKIPMGHIPQGEIGFRKRSKRGDCIE